MLNFAQKTFDLTVMLPGSIDAEKIEFYLDNGRHADMIKGKRVKDGVYHLTGEYFGLKAAVHIQYLDGTAIQGKLFFLTDRPGSIRFQGSNDSGDKFGRYILKNVEDYLREQRNMSHVDSAERRIAREFENANGDKVYSGKYPDLQKYYFNVLLKNIGRKKLAYILSTPGSYFSFYSFRSDIVWPGVLPADSSLLLLNTLFPDAFKNSDEGNDLKDYILSRIPKTTLDAGTDFTSRDTQGKMVRLSDFKGENPVLLHFWATWCSPCIRELPMIAKIDSQYQSSGLRIISIASKSARYQDFTNFTRKYKMNWVNIYDDEELIYRYGNYPIPRLILIDRAGRVLYDSSRSENMDDGYLNGLKQLLNEQVKN